MKKYSFEKLNDPFLNIYEQWLFIRSFENSAIFISQLTWYRLFPNIDKKTWKIFLECAFPKNKKSLIIKELEREWYNIRIIDKEWNIEETIWNNKIEKDYKKLLDIKKTLTIFE